MEHSQMKLFSVRGAIQCEQDSSTAIKSAVTLLMTKLLKENSLTEDLIVHILFSQTEDLVSENPATALRSMGFHQTPLFCSQEPSVTNSMPRVIRVLITFYAQPNHQVTPMYLGGAAELRKDLTSSS
jgi:chorismate mutase